MAPTADVLPAVEASTRPSLMVQPSDTKIRKASSFRTEQVVIDGQNLKIQGLVASHDTATSPSSTLPLLPANASRTRSSP